MVSKNLILAAGTTILTLLIAEGGLRLAGYEPWIAEAYANRTVTTQAHPRRGWDLKEGIFHQAPYSPQSPSIVYTQLPGKFRLSASRQDKISNNKPKLVMVGGSYTRGNAISDNETFSWKLQQKFQALEILNYGVGGYGTLQSLMKLEEILPTLHQRKLVIYGLIEHHGVRNVATPGWVFTLSRYTRSNLNIPYVKTGKKGLIQRQPPLHFSPFPLREHSALIALIEKAWISAYWRKHKNEPMDTIMLDLVTKMQRLSSEHNADFLVVLLSVSNKTMPGYMKAFAKNKINALNCSFPLTRDMIVIGDGHPNGRMNSKWAHCISNYLKWYRENNRNTPVSQG